MKKCALSFLPVLAMTLMCVSGCGRQDYSDPKAFIEKYVIEPQLAHLDGQFMKKLHFKAIEITDAHLGMKRGETTVFATLRIVPESGKTLYAYPEFARRGSKGVMWSEVKVLSREELDDELTAEVEIPRSRMDTGVFAPSDPDSIRFRRGWRNLDWLVATDEEELTKQMKILSEHTPELEMIPGKTSEKHEAGVRYITGVACYAVNGQLDIVKDADVLRALLDWAVIMRADIDIRPALLSDNEIHKRLDTMISKLQSKGVEPSYTKEEAWRFYIFRIAGKKLLEAINAASTTPDANGISHSAWPKSKTNVHGGQGTIDGVAFQNSTQYFKRVLGLDGGENLAKNTNPDTIIDKATDRSLWSIALDVDETTPDNAPVLISANFDCSNLPAKWSGDNGKKEKPLPIGTCPILGEKCVIAVMKNGVVTSMPAKEVKMRYFCFRNACELPRQYLSPDGIVSTKK